MVVGRVWTIAHAAISKLVSERIWTAVGAGEITIDGAAEESVCPQEWGKHDLWNSPIYCAPVCLYEAARAANLTACAVFLSLRCVFRAVFLRRRC